MQSFRPCGNNASVSEERQLVHVCTHQGRKAKQLRKCQSAFTVVINEGIARALKRGTVINGAPNKGFHCLGYSPE